MICDELIVNAFVTVTFFNGVVDAVAEPDRGFFCDPGGGHPLCILGSALHFDLAVLKSFRRLVSASVCFYLQADSTHFALITMAVLSSKPSFPIVLISTTALINILVFLATMFRLFGPEPSITYSTSRYSFSAHMSSD